ncbi:MAG: ABC transporter permease [Acidimicrobiales bacterium]
MTTVTPGLGAGAPAVASRLDRWVEDARVRRAFNWAAAALALYWVVERLWDPPVGVILKGAVIGGLYSLLALGVALVYRANRIINFAQGDMGGAPAALTVMLLAASHWPYPLAIATGLVSGVVVGVVVEFVIIRNFSRAPRLVLTVVTIGISQLLTIVEVDLPQWFGSKAPPQTFPSPFNFHFNIGPVRFYGNDVLAMVMIPVVIVGLGYFLNRTNIGVAVRACAESADRASLLGVPIKRVNLTVWAVASLMATIAIILNAGVVGLGIGSPLGLSVLLLALAACVLGRMENMVVIAGAAILLGVVQQSVVWHTGSSDQVYIIEFLVIMVGLLAQRGRLATRAETAGLSTWTAIREVRPIPPELRRLPEVLYTRAGLAVAGGALVLFIPALVGEARTVLASFLCAYLIIALSMWVLVGWTGQISLGQFGFVGVGSTVAAWTSLHWHMDISLQLAGAGVIGALVAVLIGIPALRIRGLMLAVATLAFGFGANFFLLSSSHFSWIPNAFTQIPRLPLFGRVDLSSSNRFYYFSLAVLLLCVVAVLGLRNSRIGRVLIAVRENERGVQAYGVNLTRTKLTGFAISGFLAAVAGVLIFGGQQYLYSGAADPQSSLDVFVMVVIGGLGSMTGVFAGAIYLEGLSWLTTSVPHSIQSIFTLAGSGLGLIIILAFLPGGVGSAIYLGRDRLLRLVADRRGIVVPSLVADMAVYRDEPDPAAGAPPEEMDPLAALEAGEALELLAGSGRS